VLVRVGPTRQRQIGQVRDLGHPHVAAAGEEMSARQQQDLALRAELFGVEPGSGVERQVQQRHVGSAVAQQPFLLGRPAQQHVDGDRTRLGCVGVEQFGQ
jgi:hypothetical protein